MWMEADGGSCKNVTKKFELFRRLRFLKVFSFLLLLSVLSVICPGRKAVYAHKFGRCCNHALFSWRCPSYHCTDAFQRKT